jgi:gamma-glutamylcyclotransferase (GGCT)/AIG2-like uncharacterized protein YtfP
MLYFAYGSNMSPAVLQAHCPGARWAGRAVLHGWDYGIMREGYATVLPRRGSAVHGVLWRLGPGDLRRLDLYEEVSAGLYVRRVVRVSRGPVRVTAITYIARRQGRGRPRAGYQDGIVIPAATRWKLPAAYIRGLRRFVNEPR